MSEPASLLQYGRDADRLYLTHSYTGSSLERLLGPSDVQSRMLDVR